MGFQDIPAWNLNGSDPYQTFSSIPNTYLQVDNFLGKFIPYNDNLGVPDLLPSNVNPSNCSSSMFTPPKRTVRPSGTDLNTFLVNGMHHATNNIFFQMRT